MKNKFYQGCCSLLLCVSILHQTSAQQLTYKAPILQIDFGSRNNPSPFIMGNLKAYQQQKGTCPDDGNYAFASYTSNCFNGDWITMNEDHTPGDYDGKMLLVNASPSPGIFFQCTVPSIKPNTRYEFSCWIVNVCRTSSPCNPTPPYINFMLQNSNGHTFKTLKTGRIPPTNAATWRRYSGQFTSPAGASVILIKMEDETNGGCGNDFAVDDILVREIEIVRPEPPKQVANPVAKPTVKPSPAIATKPEATKPVVVKKETTPNPPPLKKTSTVAAKEEVKALPSIVNPSIKETAKKIPVPDVLLSRSNPVVKQIETSETEVLIELYDNGEIDGDTVSIYHNNTLLVANAGLSEKAVSIKIKVDKAHPQHELVMVANNLGSIPPNTSLMVITAQEKRYEVFISSSNQKNAKILIHLVE
jgi:hypothetical protein